MRKSAKKYVAAFAVVIIVAAALIVYLDPFAEDDESDARYLYNYSYEDVDSIMLTDGSTVTKDDADGATAIRVYTVAFENNYTSPVSFYLYPASSVTTTNMMKMVTTVTNPENSTAVSKSHSETGIEKFFAYTSNASSSYYRTVAAGTEAVFQVAFYLKDYSSEAGDDSEISTELVFDQSDIKNHGEKSGKVDLPEGPVLQYTTSPSLYGGSSVYTEQESITLSDGSTATADNGYCYRVYRIGMRSTGEACTVDPSDIHLMVSVTTNKNSSTSGQTYDAVTDFIDTSYVSLDAWSDNENTACKTMTVAFLMPESSNSAFTVGTSAYLLIDDHCAGYINKGNAYVNLGS